MPLLGLSDILLVSRAVLLHADPHKTLSGSGFFLYFRAYGPKKEFFDLDWVLNDLKKL